MTEEIYAHTNIKEQIIGTDLDLCSLELLIEVANTVLHDEQVRTKVLYALKEIHSNELLKNKG